MLTNFQQEKIGFLDSFLSNSTTFSYTLLSLLLLGIISFLLFPYLQTRKISFKNHKEKLETANSIRQTYISLFSSLIVIASILMGFKQLKITQEDFQNTLRLQEEQRERTTRKNDTTIKIINLENKFALVMGKLDGADVVRKIRAIFEGNALSGENPLLTSPFIRQSQNRLSSTENSILEDYEIELMLQLEVIKNCDKDNYDDFIDKNGNFVFDIKIHNQNRDLICLFNNSIDNPIEEEKGETLIQTERVRLQRIDDILDSCSLSVEITEIASNEEFSNCDVGKGDQKICFQESNAKYPFVIAKPFHFNPITYCDIKLGIAFAIVEKNKIY